MLRVAQEGHGAWGWLCPSCQRAHGEASLSYKNRWKMALQKELEWV